MAQAYSTHSRTVQCTTLSHIYKCIYIYLCVCILFILYYDIYLYKIYWYSVCTSMVVVLGAARLVTPLA